MLAADAENVALSKRATIMFGVAAITLDAARAETAKVPPGIEGDVEQAIALAYAIRCCPAPTSQNQFGTCERRSTAESTLSRAGAST